MARSKDLWRGHSRLGTQVAERRPSGLSSMNSMRTLDRQDLVIRMRCCAASEGFTEEGKRGLIRE